MGIFLSARHAKDWRLLGSILLLVGSVTVAGGVILLYEGGSVGFLIVAASCAVGSVLARSGLLATLAVLALSSAVGAMTAYGHATYMLSIRQPTVTVGLFSILAWGAYHLSKWLPRDFGRLAVIVARASLFVVNLGFWVGSLWGDSLWLQRDVWDFRSGAIIPAWVFGMGWAAGLIATAVWAARAGKRWVMNLLAVFGSIHFYTQYFERLGASPASVLIAGLVALGIALALVRYNKAAVAATAEAVKRADSASQQTECAPSVREGPTSLEAAPAAGRDR